MAMEPSPTAEDTPVNALKRTSPEAKIPGTLVIAAHLQAHKTSRTKPNLQKSCNFCQRTAPPDTPC